MRFAALTALLLALNAPALAAGPEPIDDLQRLFIEDTVALIQPPGADAGSRARALMDEAGAARASGDLSAMRRKLAEARVILGKGEWNADTALLHSLAIRPDRIVADPSRDLTVDVAQRFRAELPGGELRLTLGLRGRGKPEIDWRVRVSKVSSDMIDSPVRLHLPLTGLADGAHDLVLRASEGERELGVTTLGLWIVAGLDRDLATLATAQAGRRRSRPVAMALAWPENLARTMNTRMRQPLEVDWRALLDRTLALAGSDDTAFARARGVLERFYPNSASHRIEPYRLFIPESWDGKSALPLVVLLHGSNADHTRTFASGKAVEAARKRGWALLSPMGYSPNSGWGNHLPVVLANGTMPAPRPSTINGVVLPRDGVTPEPAEVDVFEALADVQANYPVDPRRIYLAGNSMGGEGTWHLARKLPSLWAAVAPGAGAIDPAHYPYQRLGKLPVLAVHGDADAIISFAASAEMVDRLNRAGGKGELLRVAGGGHSSFDPSLDRIFDFFAKHSRKEGP
ncbi:MAG: dienelactone hydrolase family protein [Novosphingobium sp.]